MKDPQALAESLTKELTAPSLTYRYWLPSGVMVTVGTPTKVRQPNRVEIQRNPFAGTTTMGGGQVWLSWSNPVTP